MAARAVRIASTIRRPHLSFVAPTSRRPYSSLLLLLLARSRSFGSLILSPPARLQPLFILQHLFIPTMYPPTKCSHSASLPTQGSRTLVMVAS